jgi:hypothetical protein
MNLVFSGTRGDGLDESPGGEVFKFAFLGLDDTRTALQLHIGGVAGAR